MTQKPHFALPALLALLLLLGTLPLAAHASTVSPSPDSVPVYDTVLSDQLAQMQATLDSIAAALAGDAAAPDYSGQLSEIEATLSTIQENTAPSPTPDQMPELEEQLTVWQTPFEEYTLSETLLLILTGVIFTGVVLALFLYARKR